MHGQGKIEFINGIAYEGLWENGLPHGAGGKFGPIDGKVFECQAVYGSATGTGKITFDTGDIYEGEIRMGKEYGQGKLTKADGTINEGTFKDGIFKG